MTNEDFANPAHPLNVASVLSGFLRPIETADGSRTMCVGMGEDRLQMIISRFRGFADHLEGSLRKENDGRQDTRKILVDQEGLAAIVAVLRSEKPTLAATLALSNLLSEQGYH